MSLKIFVGYKLKPVDYLQELLPTEPAVAEGTEAKEAEKLKKDWEKKVAALRDNATNMVYTATFQEVCLFAPQLKDADGQLLDLVDTKTPQGIANACHDWLQRHFLNAWARDVHPAHQDVKAYFIGFEPRLFLKLLGLECSMPAIGLPLPPPLWYGNTDHRDIEEAIMPAKESKAFAGDWEFIKRARRRGLQGIVLERYDALMNDWRGPGQNAYMDIKVASLFAGQLGF